MRVGYLGPDGTLSHEAVLSAAGPDAFGLMPLPTLHEAVIAVHDGDVERALVPIENSLEGPVGVTLDLEAGLARVICGGGSQKVRNVRATGVAVGSQVEGRLWSTLEGSAVVRDDPDAVADAVARYAVRYRQPRVNPERVVIEIAVRRALGLR